MIKIVDIKGRCLNISMAMSGLSNITFSTTELKSGLPVFIFAPQICKISKAKGDLCQVFCVKKGRFILSIYPAICLLFIVELPASSFQSSISVSPPNPSQIQHFSSRLICGRNLEGEAISISLSLKNYFWRVPTPNS